MAVQRTLSIIKPGGLRRNLIGKINSYIEEAGLRIVAQKMMVMTPAQAASLYEAHKERDFFADHVKIMSSSAIVAQVVEGENAIEKYRTVMGATDPKKAASGTIRGDMAVSIDDNLVHGSDGEDSAAREISLLFDPSEIVG
jgi:nucleoside-diphosphate kinase